jgi:hypothetical protein
MIKKKETEIEETIKNAFNTLKRKQVKKQFNALFTGKQKRNITGSGYGTLNKKNDDGRFSAPEPARADKYLKLGKYKANKEKLLGGN